MRGTCLGLIAGLALAGHTADAWAGKFSFFGGGSKKISRAAEDAPKVDEETVDHGVIADGLDLAIDLGGEAIDRATDEDEDEEAPRANAPGETVRPLQTVDLGGGMTATLRKARLGRMTLVIDTPSGTIKSTLRRRDVDIVAEATRMLNLRTLPATGQVQRDALLADGTLRPATEADLDAWKAAALRRSPHAATRIRRDRRKFYVLTRPLSGTELMVGGGSRTALVIPKGIALDRAPMGAGTYYTLDDGHCTGIGDSCRRFHEQARETDTAACFPGLPRDVELHAFGAYEATPNRKSDIVLGRSDSDRTGQIDIYVAPTSSPVVLLLGAFRPVVWAIHRAEGAEIAAILTRGFHTQAVAGVSDVPVRFSTRKDGLAPGCGGYASDYEADSDRDIWFEEAKEIFGRAVQHTDGEYYGKTFAVGAWDGLQDAAPLPVTMQDIRASGPVAERGIDIPKGKLMIFGLFAFVFRKRITNFING